MWIESVSLTTYYLRIAAGVMVYRVTLGWLRGLRPGVCFLEENDRNGVIRGGVSQSLFVCGVAFVGDVACPMTGD